MNATTNKQKRAEATAVLPMSKTIDDRRAKAYAAIAAAVAEADAADADTDLKRGGRSFRQRSRL